MSEVETVLVAEDDAAMREYLVEMLTAEGFRVVEARNGRELFWAGAAPAHRVAVVVSDVRMPAYDGLEVAEAWSSAGDAPKLILMSAFPDAKARMRADALGVTLLEKPFEPRVLIELVKRLVGRSTW